MKKRQDIQALRGLAVILVVFYHANLFSIESGYLGVDIFFVISGFLITQQISRKVINNTFSFKEFYLRRAYRLLPAAYAVVFLTSILAPFFLIHAQQEAFAKQILGALTFTANFVLYSQGGYFSTAAELKPLLHTWSLSIEEQYYFAVPFIMVFLNRKYWLLCAFIISAISLTAYFRLNPNASFYFTFSRCWELGAGTILAISLIKNKIELPSIMAYLSLPLLLLIVFTSLSPSNESINVLLIVLLTSIIIACNASHFNSGFIVNFLARIGTISYSLYLVHWPILALINNANVSNEMLPLWIRLCAITASFIAAILLYKFIETRFRYHHQVSKKPIQSMVAVTVILAISSLAFFLIKPPTDYAYLMRNNLGFSSKCSNLDFFSVPECSNAKKPEMLIWGDSFAMHLISGVESSNKGVIQATKTTCLPIKGISFFNPPVFDKSWGQECIKFNNNVLNYLKTNSSIKTVVMASAWRHLLNLDTQTHFNDKKYQQTSLNNQQIADQIIVTANEIRSYGLRVIIVAPPPASGFNIGRCHEKRLRNQIKIGGGLDCSLDYKVYKKFDEKVSILTNHLELRGEKLYSFEKELCNSYRCETTLDNVILYMDNGHLSYAGSSHYGGKFRLYETLTKLAQ